MRHPCKASWTDVPCGNKRIPAQPREGVEGVGRRVEWKNCDFEWKG